MSADAVYFNTITNVTQFNYSILLPTSRKSSNNYKTYINKQNVNFTK